MTSFDCARNIHLSAIFIFTNSIFQNWFGFLFTTAYPMNCQDKPALICLFMITWQSKLKVFRFLPLDEVGISFYAL